MTKIEVNKAELEIIQAYRKLNDDGKNYMDLQKGIALQHFLGIPLQQGNLIYFPGTYHEKNANES